MITIIGAGLVGSLWAIFLRKKGYEVNIFERRKDPRLYQAGSGRSINLVLTSRGLYALEQAGLLEEVKSLVVPVYGRMIHSVTGETTYQPYGQVDECNYSISREALNRLLINQAEQAGAKFNFECELQTINVEEKKAEFSTSTGSLVVSYEILFGADGAGSRVRKHLAFTYPSLLQENTEWIEANYKELTLPSGIDGAAAIPHQALHIWPRGNRMMMALANLDGSFTITLYLPKIHFESLTTSETILELFQNEFADALPLMPSVVSEILHHPQGNLGTVRCSRWVIHDSIALIGDAAHAIVPFFGQGMNCGFEDCTILNRLLEPVSSSDSDSNYWPHMLNQYEIIQKPNAYAIADMAVENWMEMKDKVADKKFLLRKKLESELEKRYPAIYKSRYGLVTYTLVPYALAQQAGELQKQILDKLISNEVNTLDDISWQKVESLIMSQWQPFLKAHNLNIQRYVPKMSYAHAVGVKNSITKLEGSIWH